MKKVLFLASEKKDACNLQNITQKKWSLVCPEEPDELLELCQTSEWDAVLIDVDVSGVFILDLLEKLRSIPNHPLYYLISHTPFFQMEDFYRCYGASGFLPLPTDMQLLYYQIENLLFPTEKDIDMNLIKNTHLLGYSSAMCRVRSTIEKYANSLEPVLIYGETGCGKELVARALHTCSQNIHGPFCVHNVSCIPQTLADSVLFGAIRGSFTGSLDIPGIFENAHNGTLFLDEIGTLDFQLQAKLLRTLEEKVVCRIGCNKPRPANFRLVSATNVNLDEAVNKKAFRQDLFYRLDVLRINIPPLRERKEDIPVLAKHFLKKFGKNLSSSCCDNLSQHPWPGNVRQLFQCLNRAAINCEATVIYPEHIQF